MTETKLFYYVVPAQVDGRWTLVVDQPLSARPVELAIEQWPDRLEGAAIVDGASLAPARPWSVRADATLVRRPARRPDARVPGAGGPRRRWRAR